MNDISEGIVLFNDAEFFEAHDFFEDLWFNAPVEEKFFFQALVHVSVASFHLISGNIRGALSQYSKGRMKLERYVPQFFGVDTENLIVSINRIVSEIQKEGENSSPDNLADKLPKIIYSK